MKAEVFHVGVAVEAVRAVGVHHVARDAVIRAVAVKDHVIRPRAAVDHILAGAALHHVDLAIAEDKLIAC